MNVVENLKTIKSLLPQHVKLVAVSKTKPVEVIKQVYDAGHKIFGENKVQELVSKYGQLPKDIEWHMIGHLQTNKVKYIVPFINLIHSVDSLKLLNEINKRAQKINRKINVLIQLHIAHEQTKFGMSYQETEELFNSGQLKNFPFVNVTGLMGMATNTDDMEQVRAEFRGLKEFFDMVKNKYFAEKQDFKELSMGMSHDFHIAIQEGSTIVRIGSKIFGPRQYA